MRGDNAKEAAERFVTQDDERTARVLIGGVPVDLASGWGQSVAPLVRQLRRAVEELIREREAEAAEAATVRAEEAQWSRDEDDDWDF